jgi:segregation and condensation protein A
MAHEEEYKVKLEVFEGPLDLLLYLIKKEELEIHNIPMETITTQYIQYLELMKMLDLNIAGEFLVMAATLMMIKSRMLLPVEERPELEEEEDDPRWDLVRQLVEYKKFKDAALHLEALELRREDIFGRDGAEAVLGKESEVALHDVGLFDLISAFNEALKKVKSEELREIFAERFTVAEKIEALGDRLRREGRFSLSQVFAGMRSRHEIACTFLALLELIRLNQARAVQKETYGEIFIERAEGIAELVPPIVEESPLAAPGQDA